MTVRELLRAIWNGRWFVLGAIVVVVAASYVYAQKQVITYRAATEVQLATIDDTVSTDAGVKALVTPDVREVTSSAVLAAAASEPGVDAGGLAQRVSASWASDTHTMQIAADAPTIDEAIATANAVADAYAATVPTTVSQQIADIDKQVQDLRTRLATAQAQLATDPEDPLAQSDVSSIVARYGALTAAKSAYQLVSVPATVPSPATGAIPLGLGPTAIIALGVLAGLVAGLGVALAHRGLSLRLRGASEAAKAAQVPVIAELDDVKRAVRTFRVRGLLPVASRAATPYTESIRELRTAVQVGTRSRLHPIVVVTATDTTAPRAFITANLAASWALSGRRTIVVAGDMRRPEIADLLPVEPQWSGERGAARPTLVPNLSIVPVSDSPLDPADYLATDEVRTRLEELREQADVVIVDAPPVLAAADATILGTYADGAVLVTSADKSDRNVLEAASERLRTNGVTLFGVVLSGVRSRRRKSYATTYGGETTSERPPAHASRPVPTQVSGTNLEQPDHWLPTDQVTSASQRAAATPRRAVSRPVVVADETPIPVPDVAAD